LTAFSFFFHQSRVNTDFLINLLDASGLCNDEEREREKEKAGGKTNYLFILAATSITVSRNKQDLLKSSSMARRTNTHMHAINPLTE